MSIERIGRYQIEETLGRGAMGVVYRARDPIIDRQVALKTMRVDLDAEHAEEFRERFVREAQAAGRLNHPGIVTVHDVGEDPESGLVYIAMEYVEGRDLKQMLASGHRFRPSETARIAADVATALDYAHSLGVVHRDIKPANIILTPDGTAKITDFGIARLETSNLTVDGQFIGTPNFMSPEQITGKPVDGRSDIFSLGVVLFNLLTEKKPFNGGTMHEVTLRIVQEPCPIPSTLSTSSHPHSIRSSSSVSRKIPTGVSRPAPRSRGSLRPSRGHWSNESRRTMQAPASFDPTSKPGFTPGADRHQAPSHPPLLSRGRKSG